MLSTGNQRAFGETFNVGTGIAVNLKDVATEMFQALAAVPRLVVSKILNHAEQGVTRVYDRHSYNDEKREALEKWADALCTIIGRTG